MDQSTIDIVINLRNQNVFQTAENNANKAFNKIDSRVRRSSNLFNNMFSQIGMLAGGFGIGMLAKNILQMGADLESTKISFEVMTGNAEIAAGLLEKLNKFANETPYENDTILNASKMMMNYGLATESVMPNIKMLGDIASGNAEKMMSLTLAFSQIQSSGRLLGQDLLQLVNVGINPLQIISEKTGRSMLDLKKDMEAGKISSQMVADAFRLVTSEGGRFYNMMERQSQTLNGLWSTFTGNLKYVIATIVEANNSGVKDFVKNLIDMSNWVKENSAAILKWGVIIGKLIFWFVLFKGTVLLTNQALVVGRAVMTAYKITTIALTQGLNAANVATKALNLSMKSNVIGLAITGFIFLITKLVQMNNEIKNGTQNQSEFADQIQRTKDLANNVKQAAIEFENIRQLSNAGKVELFGNLETQYNEFIKIRDKIKVEYANSDIAKAHQANVKRMLELNKMENRSFTETLELQKLIGVTRNQEKYGEDEFLLKRNEITKAQLFGNIAELKRKMDIMRGMKIPGIDPVKFDLKPSSGVNDLTTELSTKRNIKNITLNIQNLTGVENLTTTTITESREQIGKMILDELNKATYQYVAPQN
jgi:tape measure domain-containing protein